MQLCFTKSIIIVIHLVSLSELLYLYRQGNDWVLDDLAKVFMPFIRKRKAALKAEFECIGFDEAEYMSQYYMCLVKCIDNFCESRAVDFKQFFFLNLQYDTRNYIRKMKAKKLHPLSYEKLLEKDRMLVVNDLRSNPEKYMAVKSTIETLKQFQASTKGVEKAVVTCMIAGMTSKEIQNSLPYDARTVANAIYRIRRKLRKIEDNL